MLKKLAIVSALVASAALAAPAAADSFSLSLQFGDGYYEPRPRLYAPAPVRVVRYAVAPSEVRRALRRSGFTEIGAFRRSGSYYKVETVDPSGNLVDLSIDIYSGDIVRARIIEAAYRVDEPDYAPHRHSEGGDALVIY